MNNKINPTPIKSYSPPKLPTLENARNNRTLLEEMPLRWKRSAALLTCAGVMGTWLLTACEHRSHHGGSGFASYIPQQTEAEVSAGIDNPEYQPHVYTQEDLVFRLHNGGSGAAIYVVHLTEQEAFGIIRSQLELAGLRFDDEPPNFIACKEMSNIGLDLFDSKRNVAIAHVSWEEAYKQFWHRSERDILKEFEAQCNDVTFGVFFNRSTSTDFNAMWHYNEDGEWVSPDPPTEEEIEAVKKCYETRQRLEQDLTQRIEAFVTALRKDGVLQ